VAFCRGLLLAAVVVEQFEDVLEHHVSVFSGLRLQNTHPAAFGVPLLWRTAERAFT
jgi:hypothetical protein